MKVRMLCSLGGEPPHAYGDVVDVCDEVGGAWITERMAESVDAGVAETSAPVADPIEPVPAAAAEPLDPEHKSSDAAPAAEVSE